MRYLISGYYGEGNAGDEAILTGILAEVAHRDPQARFTVLSFDPSDTERRHDVDAVSTSLRDPGRLARLMRQHDVLISGGGSFLHEADFAVHGRSFLLRAGKLRPIPYFLSVVALAQRMGLPVIWYAQGLGPLHTRAARRLVGLLGSRSEAVTWRDVDSARLAWEVGVRAPVQLVVPDPAYAVAPWGAVETRALLADRGFPSGLAYVAVCPRPWLGRLAYQDALTEAVAAAAGSHDLAVLLVPFQERLDGPLCRTLASDPRLAERSWVLRDLEEAAALAGVLGQAHAAVTMRLHAGILAATAGTPAVIVDYDPKVRAFAAQTGQLPWTLTVDELEAPGGGGRAAWALEDTLTSTSRRPVLRRRVAPLRSGAGQTAQLAVQLAVDGALVGARAGPGGRHA